MATIHKREGPGLKQLLIWGILNTISGHSKEIDRKPMSSYRKVKPKPALKKISNYQPPPLTPALARRSSCLTPPPQTQEEEEEGVREFEQKQSPLFRLLPEEVSLLIYEEVIGKRVIHVVRRNRSLGHATCLSENGDQDKCREVRCRGTKLPNGVCVLERRNHDSFVALLQTCRKM
jgi:hypothetical protein